MAQKKLKPLSIVVLLAILAVTWWLENRKPGQSPSGGPSATRDAPGNGSPRAEAPPQGDGALAQAIRAKRSGVWVEGEGMIVHLLPDDRIAPRHQLCLVELAGGHTIKISHNVDLAPNVRWKKGREIEFRGRFEWTDKGGVVHWTHHDPQGRKPGGWLRYEGKTYR